MALEKWDTRFLNLAKIAAEWSKDPRAQVGATVVDHQGQVAGVGYNGFPKLVEDSAERYGDVDTKLEMVVHAEENAILGAGTRAWRVDLRFWKASMCPLRRLNNPIRDSPRRGTSPERRNGLEVG